MGFLYSHAQFSVYPYLLAPCIDGVRMNWFTTDSVSADVKIYPENPLRDTDTLHVRSQPVAIIALTYSTLELSEKEDFPDMFPNLNVKHSLHITGLKADTEYRYELTKGSEIFQSTFRTAPFMVRGYFYPTPLFLSTA